MLNPIRFCLAMLLTAPLSIMAADEVKLIHLEATESTFHIFQQWRRLEVAVANIAYEKKVTLHIRQSSGPWKDFSFHYDRPASNGREIWVLASSSINHDNELTAAPELEFAIRYEVAGQTFWDNNQGRNYRFNRSFGNYLSEANVYNSGYKPRVDIGATTSEIEGYVTLRNIAYAKQVRVVYSTDNWTTVREAHAGFKENFYGLPLYKDMPNPNIYGFEDWPFKLDVGTTATEVVYAIEYRVAGRTYWDNNFGRDYRTRIARYP